MHELLAYMLTIIKPSQQYDGMYWHAYDTHYRISAAATGNKNWSYLNTDLFTRFFKVCFKLVSTCSISDSTHHSTVNSVNMASSSAPTLLEQKVHKVCFKLVSTCSICDSTHHSTVTQQCQCGSSHASSSAPTLLEQKVHKQWLSDICAEFNALLDCIASSTTFAASA